MMLLSDCGCGCVAELVAASSPLSIGLGCLIYVAVVVGLLGAAYWLVHTSVYKRSAHKAHYVMPSIAHHQVSPSTAATAAQTAHGSARLLRWLHYNLKSCEHIHSSTSPAAIS